MWYEMAIFVTDEVHCATSTFPSIPRWYTGNKNRNECDRGMCVCFYSNLVKCERHHIGDIQFAAFSVTRQQLLLSKFAFVCTNAHMPHNFLSVHRQFGIVKPQRSIAFAGLIRRGRRIDCSDDWTRFHLYFFSIVGRALSRPFSAYRRMNRDSDFLIVILPFSQMEHKSFR
jgi:hypothetical protein